MKDVRAWLVAGVAWLLAWSGLGQFLPELQMVPLAHAFVALSPLVMIGLPPLERARSAICIAGALIAYLAARSLRVASPDAVALSGTLVELVAIGGAVFVWHRLAGTLAEFREALVRMTLGAPATSLADFETAQSELYREVRRSRRFGRPLTLMALQAEGATESPPNRLLERIQRENVERYAAARLARMLTEETKDCDVVVERDSHLLSLLAETTREDAERIVARVAKEAHARYGLALRVGLSSFPDEEVTFEGLVARAEEEMRSAAPERSLRRLAEAETRPAVVPETVPDPESGEGATSEHQRLWGPRRAGGESQ